VTSTPHTIPLADLGHLTDLARRTRRLRLGVATAAVGAAAAALVVALWSKPQTTAFLPTGTNGIVVLDVSASISSDTYARIEATLDRLARSNGHFGLVLFSDTAYQALPPGTPARELGTFAQFFAVPPQHGVGAAPAPPANPWSETFSAGTRISTGLQLALDVARAQGLRRPAVLLVSDLDDDAGDIERLTSVALAYRKLGVLLHVLGLNPSPEDARLVTRLLARPGDLQPAALPSERRVDAAPSPVPLVALTLVAAVALALLLPLVERLRWRTR